MLIFILILTSCIFNPKKESLPNEILLINKVIDHEKTNSSDKLYNKQLNFRALQTNDGIVLKFNWNSLKNVSRYEFFHNKEGENLSKPRIFDPSDKHFKNSFQMPNIYKGKRGQFTLKAIFKNGKSLQENINLNFDKLTTYETDFYSDFSEDQFSFFKTNKGYNINLDMRNLKGENFIINCYDEKNNIIEEFENVQWISNKEPLKNIIEENIVISEETYKVEIINLNNPEKIILKYIEKNIESANILTKFKLKLEEFLITQNLKFNQKDGDTGLYEILDRFEVSKITLDENLKFLIYSLNDMYKFVNINEMPNDNFNKIISKENETNKFDGETIKTALNFYILNCKRYYEEYKSDFTETKEYLLETGMADMKNGKIDLYETNANKIAGTDAFRRSIKHFILNVAFLLVCKESDANYYGKKEFYEKECRNILSKVGIFDISDDILNIKINENDFGHLKKLILNAYKQIISLKDRNNQDIFFKEICKAFLNCNAGAIQKIKSRIYEMQKLNQDEGNTSIIDKIEFELLDLREKIFKDIVYEKLTNEDKKKEAVMFLKEAKARLYDRLKITPGDAKDLANCIYTLKSLNYTEQEFINEFKARYYIQIFDRMSDISELEVDFRTILENLDIKFKKPSNIAYIEDFIKTSLINCNSKKDLKTKRAFYIFYLMKMGIVKPI